MYYQRAINLRLIYHSFVMKIQVINNITKNPRAHFKRFLKKRSKKVENGSMNPTVILRMKQDKNIINCCTYLYMKDA